MPTTVTLEPDLVAALALEHGAEVRSTDGDLARSPGAGLVDPVTS